MQQEASIQEKRKTQREWAIPVQSERVLFVRYHTVALTVNLIHGTGSGNDEMSGGNQKIDVRSAE